MAARFRLELLLLLANPLAGLAAAAGAELLLVLHQACTEQ
jgi:hypothetical protein